MLRLTAEIRQLLADPIGELQLSVRTTNSLESAGIFTVEDLLNTCPHTLEQCRRDCICEKRGLSPKMRLQDIPNMAGKTIEEILTATKQRLSELAE